MQSQGLQRAELATQTRGLRPGFARTCNADIKIATQTQVLRRRCRICGAKPRFAAAKTCNAKRQVAAQGCNSEQYFATQNNSLQHKARICNADAGLAQHKARICNADAGLQRNVQLLLNAVQVFPTHRTSWAATLIVSVGNSSDSAVPSSSNAE